MKRNVSLLFAVVFLLSGCASIVSDDHYPVRINSTPDGADITIKNEDGEIVFAGTTPIRVYLESSCGYFDGETYCVTFSKAGYKEERTIIDSNLDEWYYLGNIFFGGLIGILIVDPATGSMFELPEKVSTNLIKEEDISLNEKVIRIVSMDQVPEDLRKHLIKLNWI